MLTRIKLRRGTEAQWLAANPVLASGEPSYATDTNVFKIGNGVNTWSSLPSISAGGGSQSSTVVQLGSVSGQINTIATSGSIFDLTLAANGSLNNPVSGVDGQTLRWRITYGNNNLSLGLGNNFNIPSSANDPLSFSTTSGTTDVLGATYDQNRDKWDIIAFVPGY